MSDSFWNSLPATIAASAAAIAGLFNHFKLKTVSKEIDGMKDELVASTKKASLAEGKAAGIKEEQRREK